MIYRRYIMYWEGSTRYFVEKNRRGDISTKYQRYIGLGRYIGDFLKKSSLVTKYRWYIEDKSSIFWQYFPSFMQRDLTVQITSVLIRRRRCNSNGNMAIQRPNCSQFFIQLPKLIFYGKLMFQRLFWPKFLL